MPESITILPVLIIVSGPPGAGKTTLARRLAERFSLPLMTKDTIKEILYDTLGWSDREWSRRLSRASILLLNRFAEAQAAAGCSCIIESNYRPDIATPEFLALKARYPYVPLQILLRADFAVLRERYRHRSQSGERHPGHGDAQLEAEFMADVIEAQMEPLGLGGEIITVDTTDWAAIDYATLFERVDGVLRTVVGG